MKKILVLLMTLMIIVTLVACGSNDETTEQTPKETEPQECAHTAEWKVITEATCIQEGSKQEICSKCGETMGTPVAIEKTSHSINEVENMCTEDLACTVCGEVFSAAQGHSFSVMEKIDATCSQEGSETKQCDLCGHTEKVTIDKAACKYETFAFADGKFSAICTVCGTAKTLEEASTPILKLDFDKPMTEELAGNEFFKPASKTDSVSEIVNIDGKSALKIKSSTYLGVKPGALDVNYYKLSYDFYLAEAGNPEKMETIFSAVLGNDGDSGNATFNWIFKYIVNEGVFSSATKKNDSSVSAQTKKWYHFDAIVNNSTGSISFYIDGALVGTKTGFDFTSATLNSNYEGKASFRFWDHPDYAGVTSAPCFDNFVIVEVK